MTMYLSNCFSLINIMFLYFEKVEFIFTCRPVRMHMDIDTNMQMIGKREPYYATFKVMPHMMVYWHFV